MSKYHRGQFTDSKKIILHSETKPNVLDDGNKDESESDIEWNYESDQDDNDSTKQNLNSLNILKEENKDLEDNTLKFIAIANETILQFLFITSNCQL